MGDSRLRKAHAFFNVTGAEPLFPGDERTWRSSPALFERDEDATPGRIGNGL